MDKHYYIRRNKIHVFSFTLDAKYSVGKSYEDNLKGMYVPLSQQQVDYHLQHPEAGAYEVWTTTPPAPYTPALEEVKAMKIAELEEYDRSDNVNSFTLDGAPLWLPRETRMSLRDSISIEVSVGRLETTLWISNKSITIECAKALQMLAALELYALECYNRTAAHRAAILALETIEAVQGYDHTAGYPALLELTTKR